MRFVNFDIVDVARDKPGAIIRRFGAPPGHEDTTGALCVAVEPDAEYMWKYNFMIEFTDDEINHLIKTKRAWVGQVGAVLQPVFCGGVVASEQ